MNNALTIRATITVESTGKVIDTLDDWGCAIGNNDYIGEPETETYYIDVPGADGFLDGSEAITGRQVYKSREINVLLGGKKPREDWDSFISTIRNQVHGRIIKVTFSNDPSYYWTGRAYITEFDRFREIGQFHLSIPKADPYKYSIADSTEDWLWDPLNLERGAIENGSGITISESGSYTIHAGDGVLIPEKYHQCLSDMCHLLILTLFQYRRKQGTPFRSNKTPVFRSSECLIPSFSFL